MMESVHCVSSYYRVDMDTNKVLDALIWKLNSRQADSSTETVVRSEVNEDN